MMLSRQYLQTVLKATSRRCFSSFSKLSIDQNKHSNIHATINHLDQSKDLSEVNELLNHHSERLQKLSTDQVEKEYMNIYNLALKLAKLLENTPDVSEEFKKEVLNSLIEKFTRYNYAVATLAFKKLLEDKRNLSLDAVNEIIQHNPGRVNPTWNLYNSLKPEQSHDQIMLTTMKKLLKGDPVEIKENLNKVDIVKLTQILEIYGNISQKDLIDEQTYLELLKNVFSLHCGAVVTWMVLPSSVVEKVIEAGDDFKLENADYLFLYEASINNGYSLSGNSLLRSFMPISRLQLSSLNESENIKILKEKLGFEPLELAPLPDVVDEIREQIQELELDDNIEVKLNLIKSAGFHSKDLATAIKYFQLYQTKIPDGTLQQNDLKSTMSLVFVYDGIYKDESKMNDVAEALVPQTPLPYANNIAGLMLSYAWFGDGERAIETYNKALNLFLEPMSGNEVNRGQLTQSLIIATLLEKDVGLARMIKERNTENKTIDETYEIKLSSIFKEYGDIVEQCKDNETLFREKMKKIILRTLMEYAP
ncbi:hypothetical protein CANINC_000547 [Pichia inconspicua]|uniref:Uncharacterized protein n=1 Tax=Pichia inconspicua TaxID=52247 RepID=A0A4T0X5V9_9ASCO|nr:hypothetical protein CANINC_000547 [[Candida] inconspicua]